MNATAETAVAEKLTLRPYQQIAATDLMAGLAEATARILLVLPPGAGKTEVAVKTVEEISRREPDARFMVLAHRNILIKQTVRRFRRWGVDAANAGAEHWRPGTELPEARTVVTSPRTLLNRGGTDQLVGRWYLFVDEAHHGPAATWRGVISGFPGPVVGMTGTPWRLARDEGLDELFTAMVQGPQPEELIEQGYLAKPVVIAAEKSNRIVGGPKSHGEYTAAGIMAANERPILTEKAIEWWIERTGGKLQTIMYGVNKTHAWNLKECLDAAGIPSRVILSDTSERERDNAGEAFESKEIRCLINVAIYTEGADFRGAECIVMLRPTESLALYLQMVGRGTRLNDAGRTIILDATLNTRTHGLPTQTREWSLEPRGSKGNGGDHTKVCPECRTVTGARQQRCEECGEDFGKVCGQCGRWEPWSGWRKRGDICDECKHGQGFDFDAQTGVILEDGWLAARNGGLCLAERSKEATLTRMPGRRSNFKLVLVRDGRRRVQYLKGISEEDAKRHAEDILNLRGTVLTKRIRSCHRVVETAAGMADVTMKRQLLNDAARKAKEIENELNELGRNRGKSTMQREYQELVTAGRRARTEQAMF